MHDVARPFVRPPDLNRLPCSDTELCQAVVMYLCGEPSSAISDFLAVDEPALRSAYRLPGWKFLCQHAGEDFHTLVAQRASRIMSAAFDQLENRLEHGDEIRGMDGGVIAMRPLKGKDLSLILTQMAAVRENVARHSGTSSKSHASINAEKLVAALEAIADANQARRVIDVTPCASP